MFLASSNLMNITERARPAPATKSTKKNPTSNTIGRVKLRLWPEIYTTNASGIKPIKKLIKAAIEAAKANIFGGTATLVNMFPFAAIELAACSNPWLKKVLSRIPAIRYGANCWPASSLPAKKNEKTIHSTKLVSIGFNRVQPIPITLLL